MFHRATTFRVTTAMAIGGLVLGPIQPARAQPAPSPATADPPARVGRLADLAGTVSFHTADETQWSAATLNYPITGGNSVWTEPKSSAVLDLGGGRMTLDQASQVDVDTLDTQTVSATEKQGDIYLRVRSVVPGETYTVVTPRGSVVITEPGRYGIVAGDTDTPTSVTVIEGAAHVTGVNLDLAVQAHQTASITGTDNFAGTVGPAAADPFFAAQLAAERPRVAQRPPPAPRPVVQPPALEPAPSPEREVAQYEPPPVVQQMTGAEELQESGTWTEVPQYGRVWYPPVEQGYVPYRHGHWAFVAPWGWTWVDEAPWGFAPFHYGRWVEVRDRWGWTPVAEGGDYEQPPVYAPALVSFVDPGAVLGGVAVGLAVGLAFGGHHHDRHSRGYDGDVGWVPLGYREPYYPPYRVSPEYVSRINSPNITHVEITRVANNYTTNNYYGAPAVAGRPAIRPPTFVNAGAATAVPRLVMANSNPIAPVARPLTPQQLVAARPVPQVPLAPTARTIGITPSVAQRFQIQPAQLATQQTVRTTPGPVVPPRPFPIAQPHPAVGTGTIGAAAIGAGVIGAGALGAAALAARPPLPPTGGFRAQPPRAGAAPLPTQPSIPQAVAAPGRPTPALPNAAVPRAPISGLPAAPGLANVARPLMAPSTARPDLPAPLSPRAPTLGAPGAAAPHAVVPSTTPPPSVPSKPSPAPTLAQPRPVPPLQAAVPHPAPPTLQAAPRPAPSAQPVVPRVTPPVQQAAPRPAPLIQPAAPRPVSPVQPAVPRFTPPVQQSAPRPTPFVPPAAPRFTPPIQQAPPPPVRYSPPPPPPPVRFTPPPAPPPQPHFTPPAPLPQPHFAPPPPQQQRRMCPPGHPVC